ncbi:MAG: adenylate/guanylate cyclase domain-containing protein [Candidatus Rokubacteria bacterium]|nr:adenylate/guanylate cyclase domain-containing protein [Candidatus Rokubacteria bacterium]
MKSEEPVHVRSFKSRLAVVVLGLVAVVQAASFAAVALSVRASARAKIDEELRVASALLVRRLETRRPLALDDRAAAELRLATGLHVSFVRRQSAGVTVHGSTLDATGRDTVARHVPDAGTTGVIEVAGVDHVVRATRLTGDVVAVLQRPLVDALQPWDNVLAVLLAIAAAGVLLAIGAAGVLARRVSRPVLALEQAATRVAAGDLDTRVEVHGRDALGTLAAAFNEMVASLRERDRLRRELERLGKLERFFSPRLAELLSRAGESGLAPHRENITVVFCDLHGFTAFAETAEPEEVMRLLGAYHETVGPLVFEHGGTLERFTGDGLMVIFNDPVPCPDPAAQAVRMAIEMRDAVETLLEPWRRRGHALGFGAGIATGYATLGRIGFDGRLDYTAIGDVTSLSARLCQAARDGQILVSQRVYAEVETLVHAVALGASAIHGFGKPLTVFNVVALRRADYDAARAG